MATPEEKREKAANAVSGYIEVNSSPEASVKLYSDSGAEYDEHMIALNYSGPIKLAEAVEDLQLGNKNIRILDVGAGSGLVAVELAKLGYKNVDAVDPSDGLLEVAKKKGLYGKLICHYVGVEKMPIDDHYYDLVVSAGAIQSSHIPREGVRDIIRVVKPGGFIVLVYREEAGQSPFYKDGLQPYMDQLESDGVWKLVKRQHFPQFIMDKDGLVIVYKVL